jgi:hypothetical protein
MPLQATSGAASYDAFGGGVPVVPNYIEEVFSCFLYTGTGASQTITNNIDLSTKGGMVWNKPRTAANYPYGTLTDTARGVNRRIIDSLTDGEYTNGPLSAFNSNGFTINSGFGGNTSSDTYASWTFRKQPKFFDVVTYTGTGSAQNISHSLGSVPACIIVKKTSAAGQWCVYHRGLTSASYAAFLNLTDAETNDSAVWNATNPTSTVFSVGTSAGTNSSGATYVAYLFAHDAGGFGLTGTDNVISCGTYTENSNTGSPGQEINLGFEPQFLLIKTASRASAWFMYDTMRGLSIPLGNYLQANASDAENATSGNYTWYPTATGFHAPDFWGAGEKVIYIAIRRGPMKVPTVGTSVFSTTSTSTDTGTITSNFPTDMVLSLDRTAGQAAFNRMLQDRLRGNFKILDTSTTDAENSNSSTVTFDSNTGIVLNGGGVYSNGFVHEQFRRAPSVFDIVCYTGTGTAGQTFTHNLGVAPELWIVKKRSAAGSWAVGSTSIANSEWLTLQTTDAKSSNTSAWNSTYPSSTVLTVGNSGNTNGSGSTYVAYLFATCAGVSKVFSYTGNGSSQTINCGFTGGARFVLIKRTDSTGDWYVWDSARGIVSGNDPHLSLNTTAAQVTSDDTIDTDSTGFVVNQVSATNVNVSSATYIGLAIA